MGKVILRDQDNRVVYKGMVTEDGEYHGNGKLYVNGIVEYNGQFKKGKKHGFGKEYLQNNLYIGHFKSGKRHGQGLEYTNSPSSIELIYNGCWERGKRVKGKVYHNNEPVYEGHIHKGLYHYSGKLYDNGSLVYDGEWYYGKREGKGTSYKNNKIVYEGMFVNDKFHGEGVEFDEKGLKYIGEFCEGRRHGIGAVHSDEDIYEGNWYKGVRMRVCAVL